MWELEPTDEYERRLKWFARKRRRESQAVLDNLATYLEALRSGAKPQHRPFGFMHAEGYGVWAIDQKGGGGNLAQTRLYVYPDAEKEILHLITLGDKGSQQEDIKTCSNFVAILKAIESNKNERDQAG
jgi:hypothetical protein